LDRFFKVNIISADPHERIKVYKTNIYIVKRCFAKKGTPGATIKTKGENNRTRYKRRMP
jgi:hypothetical protein